MKCGASGFAALAILLVGVQSATAAILIGPNGTNEFGEPGTAWFGTSQAQGFFQSSECLIFQTDDATFLDVVLSIANDRTSNNAVGGQFAAVWEDVGPSAPILGAVTAEVVLMDAGNPDAIADHAFVLGGGTGGTPGRGFQSSMFQMDPGGDGAHFAVLASIFETGFHGTMNGGQQSGLFERTTLFTLNIVKEGSVTAGPAGVSAVPEPLSLVLWGLGACLAAIDNAFRLRPSVLTWLRHLPPCEG